MKRPRSQSRGRPERDSDEESVASVDSGEDFGKSEAFRSHPPASLSSEEAVAFNVHQCLLALGIAPISRLGRRSLIQSHGWMLSRRLVREVLESVGGLAQLMRRHPKRFTIHADGIWAEPAGHPFITHNPARKPCPHFVIHGLCKFGPKCTLRHKLSEVTTKYPSILPPEKTGDGTAAKAKAKGTAMEVDVEKAAPKAKKARKAPGAGPKAAAEPVGTAVLTRPTPAAGPQKGQRRGRSLTKRL